MNNSKTWYRIAGERDGKLITPRYNRGDGQIYKMPAPLQGEVFKGEIRSPDRDSLLPDLELEQRRYPDQRWRMQSTQWTESNGFGKWGDC